MAETVSLEEYRARIRNFLNPNKEVLLSYEALDPQKSEVYASLGRTVRKQLDAPLTFSHITNALEGAVLYSRGKTPYGEDLGKLLDTHHLGPSDFAIKPVATDQDELNTLLWTHHLHASVYVKALGISDMTMMTVMERAAAQELYGTKDNKWSGKTIIEKGEEFDYEWQLAYSGWTDLETGFDIQPDFPANLDKEGECLRFQDNEGWEVEITDPVVDDWDTRYGTLAYRYLDPHLPLRQHETPRNSIRDRWSNYALMPKAKGTFDSQCIDGDFFAMIRAERERVERERSLRRRTRPKRRTTAAEKVSFAEYHDIVTSSLEDTSNNRDGILLDLGRVLAQVTEDALTPDKDGLSHPSFGDVANALLNPRSVLFSFPYAKEIHEKILDPLAIGERDYTLSDAKLHHTEDQDFANKHIEAFIRILDRYSKQPLMEHITAVVQETAQETLMEKRYMGNDGSDGYWQLTDAITKYRSPNFIITLTFENDEGVTVEITDDARVVDQSVREQHDKYGYNPLSMRFRDKHNENWSKHRLLPKAYNNEPRTLSYDFFHAIESEIEQELEVDAHEH